MRNKGLTLIEIMVVIVVICVLAVVLYPAISKYVTKCRLDADMETAKELATAMQEVLAESKISENAVEHATPQLISNMDGSDFRKAVYERLDVEEIKCRSKKDADGEDFAVAEFSYTLNVAKNRIELYYGGITEEYQIYPQVGKKLIK